MSKQYDNELRGRLFKNDDKQKDTHPDYRGDCQIDGISYFMDAWLKEAQSGRKYMSFSFKKKEKPSSAAPAPQKAAAAPKFDDMDDSIPF
jgi:uncharacterized protein (DUF736 family)